MTDRANVALITGASGGIGSELARVFAAKGHALALVARDEAKMQALAKDIGVSGGRAPLVIGLDLAAPGACLRLMQATRDAGVSVKTLVNNAGFGDLGPFADAKSADILGMIDLNVRVLTELTHGYLPEIIAARGGILNVASVAGFTPGPNMAVYYATKAYVVSFSEALHQELKAQGIAVTALCPGPVATGFGARAGISSAMTKGAPMLSAAEVAKRGYDALSVNRRIEAPGLADKFLVGLLNVLPNALLLPLIARVQSQRGAD